MRLTDRTNDTATIPAHFDDNLIRLTGATTGAHGQPGALVWAVTDGGDLLFHDTARSVFGVVTNAWRDLIGEWPMGETEAEAVTAGLDGYLKPHWNAERSCTEAAYQYDGRAQYLAKGGE